MKKKKLIIDTDIGTDFDDAFAVLLAGVSEEVDFLGVTTVWSRAHERARIAKKVLAIAGREDVPVFAGISKPIDQSENVWYGYEGGGILDEGDESNDALEPEKKHAVDFIIDTVMANPGEVTLITLGSLSNLAVALIKEPMIAQNLKEVISMGGVIVEGGTYDWNNGKYPMLSEPSESYHGLRFTEAFGQLAFIAKCRAEGVRDLGCCISPFNSFMIMQGIETLSLRVQREADNALALARYFKAHPLVEQVFYPGLEDDPHHELAVRYLRHGFGCVLSVVLKGDKRQTESLVDHLRLVSHLANVGDNRTLIIQPAATTHSQLSEEEQRAAGVLPTLLRISAGIEHIDDLIRDFEQAFFYVKA